MTQRDVTCNGKLKANLGRYNVVLEVDLDLSGERRMLLLVADVGFKEEIEVEGAIAWAPYVAFVQGLDTDVGGPDVVVFPIRFVHTMQKMLEAFMVNLAENTWTTGPNTQDELDMLGLDWPVGKKWHEAAAKERFSKLGEVFKDAVGSMQLDFVADTYAEGADAEPGDG